MADYEGEAWLVGWLFANIALTALWPLAQLLGTTKASQFQTPA